MRLRIQTLAALLLIGLVSADVALGAGCDPLDSRSAPVFSSHVQSSDEECGPSNCASDCYCCSVVASGGPGPGVLAPGPRSLPVQPFRTAVREGAPPLPYHPPLS